VLRHRLRCEECVSRAQGDASGWRAYRADDPEEGESPEIAYYCRVCAESEFGVDQRE
jgi:hypothetical protein